MLLSWLRLVKGVQGERRGGWGCAGASASGWWRACRSVGLGQLLCLGTSPPPAPPAPCHVWGCIDECVPVCLCIYESCGGWRGRGTARPSWARGTEERGAGRLRPFSSPPLAAQNLRASSIHKLPLPCQLGLSPPSAHFPSLGVGVGTSYPSPHPALGPLPQALWALRTLGRVGGGGAGRL